MVLSPGPCSPSRTGVCVPALKALAGELPILGPLGHQSIGAAFGGRIVRPKSRCTASSAPSPPTSRGVLLACPRSSTWCATTRWPSKAASLPECLVVTARSADGEIQGVRHRELPIEGVQFHPESILSQHGHAMLRNFLEQAR